MDLRWLAGVFAVVVAALVVVVIYNRYRINKRRRSVAAYENMRNCTVLYYHLAKTLQH